MTTLWPALSPAIRGRLAQSSLSELLASALEHHLDGSFVLETVEGNKSALVVQRGIVIKARTATPVEPLGQVLLQAGLIADTTLQSALAKAGLAKQALGQVLLEQQALSSMALTAALAEQLGRRLTLLARLPGSTAYAFYADRDFMADWLPCDADPLSLIWLALRDASESSPRQLELLRSLPGRKLRLHSAAAPERLGLTAQEQIVVTALRTRPRAIEDLQRAGLLEGERLQRLMYGLALTQQLDHGQRLLPLDGAANLQRTSRPPLGSSSLLPPGGARSSLPPAAARASLRASQPAPLRAPVSQPASLRPPVAQPAPLRAPVSQPAPLRAPVSQPASLRAPVAQPALRRPSLPGFSRPPTQPPAPHSARPSAAPLTRGGMAAASERRSESVGSLHPTDPAVLARAREYFETACEQAQRQQLDAAEKLARRASEQDPGNAEYLALHAWLRAQLGELTNPEQASQIVAALDRAVLKERESVTIRFYRGQVLNRLGREEDAVRDFRFVLRRDPGHVDAARELRIHEMRKREPQKKPSLLAKLFLR
jgi:tetratricopeptide (TPR) repeat protein